MRKDGRNNVKKGCLATYETVKCSDGYCFGYSIFCFGLDRFRVSDSDMVTNCREPNQ